MQYCIFMTDKVYNARTGYLSRNNVNQLLYLIASESYNLDYTHDVLLK